MKYPMFRWMVLPLVLIWFLPALADGQDLTGIYALYQKGKESKGVVGYMRITRQQGNSFSVGNASPTVSDGVKVQEIGVLKMQQEAKWVSPPRLLSTRAVIL